MAVISDAGLPGISDPGEELVAAARSAGREVICIPGSLRRHHRPGEQRTAQRPLLLRRLPARQRERSPERLAAIAAEPRTTVLYEAPHRLLKLLERTAGALRRGTPPAGGARTDQTPRRASGTNHRPQALTHFSVHKPQGEFTLVLGGGTGSRRRRPRTRPAWRDALQQLIEAGMKASDAAAKQLAQGSGRSKRELYALLHNTSDTDGDRTQTETTLNHESMLLRLRLLMTTLPVGCCWCSVLGAQNLGDRYRLRLGIGETAPLPAGFVVGVSAVLGVVSGGASGPADACLAAN